MKIKYQGNDEETAATTVAAFLAGKGVNAKTAIRKSCSRTGTTGYSIENSSSRWARFA